MAQGRGKEFERIIRQAFMKIPEVSVDRIHDQTTGFKGSSNICDFIVYRKPHEYYIECKTVHGNVLPFTNITENQWNGLLEKSKIRGVVAGIMCWWVDKGITRFIPIQVLAEMKFQNYKSIRYDQGVPAGCKYNIIEIYGKKKRVYFEYNLIPFFHIINISGKF